MLSPEQGMFVSKHFVNFHTLHYSKSGVLYVHNKQKA